MSHCKLSIPTLILLFTVASLATGCATSINGQSYENQTPAIELAEFFDGNVKAWGIVQNRSGNIIQRFTVDIMGTLSGDQLILDETFNYQVGDGPLQRRWVLEQTENGTWRGKANDIDSQARGQNHGNAFNLAYRMQVPVGSRKVWVNLDDWFWMMDNNTLINRSYVRKLGLTFAEITIFMQRL